MALAPLLARCWFPPSGTIVTCAVSGGPDSTALLALAVAHGCEVTAVHVDHRLRPGSAAEADVVATNARQLGAAMTSLSVEVGDGPNLEARARAARRAVLPVGALTGHTADDQAETVLLNLLRGSGLDGLAAMRPGGGHPILGLRRHETVALCAELGLATVTDPTNADPRHLRNRVRHELLVAMNDLASRDVVPLLCRLADLARDDGDLLDRLSLGLDPADARGLIAAEAPLARRALRRWLRRDGHPPDLATVERVLDVARGASRATDLGSGRSVRRHRQRLSLSEEGEGGCTE